jgi:ubiquinone/menaquinone biosynthesis C-methylase UbiE
VRGGSVTQGALTFAAMPLLPDVVEHYDLGVEAGRLDGPGVVERDRTRALVLARGPKPPAVVLDVGGGPGVHAAWLLALGYEVHLVDAMPLHVEQARAAMAGVRGGRFSATVGDARSLEAASASADLVLLCGPLYHLTEADDRRRSLTEAHRVLRPGGWLFAAGISRFASALDGIARGLLDDPEFVRIMERDLVDGQHRNPTKNPEYFATTYFHRAEDLAAEVVVAGFPGAEVVGLEGPTWLLPDTGARWADEGRRKMLMTVLERLGEEPSLLGMSAHLLAIAQKPS